MNSTMKVRRASTMDWQQIVSIYNHYIVHSVFNFEYEPYTVKTRLPWFELFQEESPYCLLVVVNAEDEVLAFGATTPFNPVAGYQTSLNMSLYCCPEWQGRGLGSLLLEALLEKGRLSLQGHRFYAGITVPNELSLKLFKKFGFIEVAHFSEVGYKFDRYWDVIWLEKKVV
ncbi:GNAT family N-acetyltransferase [Legionella spiritensis]|uniref:N-acyltransferase YncA n=1 Tax=Legionella spiritensis TaxID=452 RepID=A0A0W0Z5X5_LEGSP|nr:GNAT family N-acetyltransferase [Legionella spiritensis]KTD64302.1 N-acyltransferase YncA [Legionella spiritensis]SNV46773.1 N-acyltransferase YncA [Legionella spiritensis]